MTNRPDAEGEFVLKSAGWRLARGESRSIAAALFSVLLASCTSTGDPTMSVVSPAYNSTASEMSATSGAKTAAAADSSLQAPAPGTEAASTVMSEGDTPLPEKIAYVPETRPDGTFPVTVPAGAQAIAGSTPQPLVQQAQTAEQTQAVAQQVAAGDAAAIASKAQATTQAMSNGVYVTAGEPAQPPIAAPKKSLFASLFSTTPASAAPAPLINSRSGTQPPAQAKAVTAPAKPIVELASATPAAKPVQLASLDDPSNHITGADALPGVRQTALFEIKRKSGIDDESDVDLNEDEGGGSYQVASAAGMARLAPNGLLKQNESVDVACLKPSLVRVLKTIEGHSAARWSSPPVIATPRATAAPTAPRTRSICTAPPPTSRCPASPNGSWRITSARCPAAVASAPTATPNQSISTSAPSATGTGAAVAAAAVARTAEPLALRLRSRTAIRLKPRVSRRGEKSCRMWRLMGCRLATTQL